MKVLWCVLLVVLLPGCAGILTGGGESAPVAVPMDMAYDITLVVEQGGVAPTGEGVAGAEIGDNAKDLGLGLSAALTRWNPLIWIFGASKAADVAESRGGGRASDDSAVTDAVLKALASGGKFTYTRKVVWRPKP
ncbi:MAG TPA: hypothetical protein PLE19_12755 [Planctomycetota bacterium]|nr:hypothetical protein [Planctomycetota bacterium]HRT95761.1 hypothetical protein [Planctomycetota bacterium]